VILAKSHRDVMSFQGRALSKAPRQLGNSERVSRAARRSLKRAFTILELVTVISIIIVLAGLILATSGYVQKKGARSRTEAEIAAISAALESYKADNGIYPRGNANLGTAAPSDTDRVDARVATDPSTYKSASLFLYGELSGDRNHNGVPDSGSKTYMSLKPSSLGRNDMSNPPSDSNQVTMLRDPLGNSYGYSTAYSDYLDEVNGTGRFTTPNPTATVRGYNPTFDLWSTANSTDPAQWIKNW
jgi:type II secretory pathway pseudopilin PulG